VGRGGQHPGPALLLYERFGFVPSGRVQPLPAPFPPVKEVHYTLSL
jgi:hypothetical protein